MIAPLIAILRNIQLEPTAEEISDALWLALHMGPSEHKKNKALSATSELQLKASHIPLDQAKSIHPPAEIHIEAPTNDVTESEGGLYAKHHESSPMHPGSGIPFRTPAASALPGSLELARALRPLMRRRPSYLSTIFDEETTVHRIAEERIWMPMLQPAPERWFEVALVIDESFSMELWRQTVVELQHLLERHGAFRDVRTFRFVTDIQDSTKPVRLYAGTDRTARERNPRELSDPTGRRLILVISDCVSPAWYNGTVQKFLAIWTQTTSLALVQLLPQRLWSQTALSLTKIVHVYAGLPGTPNKQLHYASRTHPSIKRDGIPVLITTLEPLPLRCWAHFTAGTGKIPGFILDEAPAEHYKYGPLQDTNTPEQLLQNFQATASLTAFELAGLLAAAPLRLSVMRLVQQTMLPHSRQVHLAEVFLGGLLKRVSSGRETTDPETIDYDFVEGVRELLLDNISVPDAIQVLKKVAASIETRLGHSIDFEAILQDPILTDGLEISIQDRPFAIVAARVLRRLGGPYLQAAMHLENRNPRITQKQLEGPIAISLLTRQAWQEEQVVIVLLVKNKTRERVRQIEIELMSTEDYTIVSRSKFEIPALYPRDEVHLEFTIRPYVNTLRTTFNITYMT